MFGKKVRNEMLALGDLVEGLPIPQSSDVSIKMTPGALTFGVIGAMIGGRVKTRVGKDRIVPIHSKIVQLVQRRKDQGNKYLFSFEGKKISNSQYYILWNAIMEQLDIDKTPHECRHTFRSRLDSAGANKVCFDLMKGHKSKEVGERIYTHKTIQELKDAMELIDKKKDKQN